MKTTLQAGNVPAATPALPAPRGFGVAPGAAAPVQRSSKTVRINLGGGGPGRDSDEEEDRPHRNPPRKKTAHEEEADNEAPRQSLSAMFESLGLKDEHKGRKGGSMKSLRTRKDAPDDGMRMLSHAASAAAKQRGVFYPGPLEPRGLGPTPVATHVPRRDPGEHRKIFRQMTGGEPSATQYVRSLDASPVARSYDITHGMGHGQGGRPTQSADNVAAASSGANTEMIPFDDAITGNPEVSVDTRLNVRPGTHVAETVEQRFIHARDPSSPIHRRTIDAHRPTPTRSEYTQWQREASPFKDPELLGAAVTLRKMSRKARQEAASSHTSGHERHVATRSDGSGADVEEERDTGVGDSGYDADMEDELD